MSRRAKSKFFKTFLKLQKVKKRAVTPILATILILALVVAGVVIGFMQIIPFIEQSRVQTGSASVQASLIKFDNVMWDMIADSSGFYFPDSVPSRKLQISLPIGVLESTAGLNRIVYEPMLCAGGNCTGTIDDFNNPENDTYGALRHAFSSNYALLPENSIQYLTGSNPFQRRDMVAFSSLTTAITEEQSSTNLTLSRENIRHLVELNYRPKVFVTQSIEGGNPTYNVGIFLIKLNVLSSFIGTTNVFIKLTDTIVQETTILGTAGQSFRVLFSIGGTTNAYAVYSASLGGFTTQYKVTAVTYEFSISE